MLGFVDKDAAATVVSVIGAVVILIVDSSVVVVVSKDSTVAVIGVSVPVDVEDSVVRESAPSVVAIWVFVGTVL